MRSKVNIAISLDATKLLFPSKFRLNSIKIVEQFHLHQKLLFSLPFFVLARKSVTRQSLANL